MCSAFAACEKPEVYNVDEHYAIDEEKILNWAEVTDTELIKHESGLYYHIDTAGDGTMPLEFTDTLVVQYVGKLLTDSIIAETTETLPYTFVLGNGIPGWKLGLPMIREKGTVRLLIPSTLAYRDQTVGLVPPNSPLDFRIYIKEVRKKKEK